MRKSKVTILTVRTGAKSQNRELLDVMSTMTTRQEVQSWCVQLLWCTPTTIASVFIKCKKTNKLSYHLQRSLSKVPLSDQSLLVGNVESTLSQRLNDSIVTQQGFGSVALQDEAAGPAVEVCGQQQAGHRRLQVLLLILVCVEGVL